LKVSLIAAMAENRVIGINNELPWKLPADLGWFKKNTLNKPIVMGRKTWESLPFRPLPGRLNIIVTRDKHYQPVNNQGLIIEHNVAKNIAKVASVEQAIVAAETVHASEVMFVGGAMLYQQVLDKADHLYLTRVHENFKGDAWFPEIDFSQWREVFCEHHQADQNNPHQYSFYIYQRETG